MFDIAAATAFDRLNEGAFMHLADANGQPLFDADKNAVGIVMRGSNSRAGIEASRLLGNRRLREARRGGSQPMTVETNEATTNEILAACTVSWTFTELDNQPFPCTPQNALTFWGDDRFRRWREQADTWISSEANFTKG
jgi:hypothetical protein